MELIELLEDKLSSINEGIVYLELADAAWSPKYTQLVKTSKILKKAIKKLKKI